MCYDRRSFAPDAHKAEAARSPNERDRKHEETVSDLLRKANEAPPKTIDTPAPTKEYIPAK